MTKVTFSVHDGLITGFHITGHSSRSSRDEEGRIVCSAVSSAAYLVANTVTDIIGASADAAADDGDMHLEIRSHLSDCQPIMKGMELHMKELASQYEDRIRVYSEV